MRRARLYLLVDVASGGPAASLHGALGPRQEDFNVVGERRIQLLKGGHSACRRRNAVKSTGARCLAVNDWRRSMPSYRTAPTNVVASVLAAVGQHQLGKARRQLAGVLVQQLRPRGWRLAGALQQQVRLECQRLLLDQLGQRRHQAAARERPRQRREPTLAPAFGG